MDGLFYMGLPVDMGHGRPRAETQAPKISNLHLMLIQTQLLPIAPKLSNLEDPKARHSQNRNKVQSKYQIRVLTNLPCSAERETTLS